MTLQNPSYQSVQSIYPSKGMVDILPSTMADPRYWLDLSNMQVKNGLLRRRPGLTLFKSSIFSINAGNEVFFGGVTAANNLFVVASDRGLYYRPNQVADFIASGSAWDASVVEFVQFASGADEEAHWTFAFGSANYPARPGAQPTQYVRDLGGGSFNSGEFSPVGIPYDGARTGAIFNDRLFVASVKTGSSTEDSYVVSWSDAGDFDDFENGTTGSILLPWAETPVIALLTLGDRLVIYTQNEIGLINNVGGDVLYTTEYVTSHNGMLPAGQVVETNGMHIVPTRSGVYVFTGLRELIDISAMVSEFYQAQIGSALTNGQCFHDPKGKRFFLSVASGKCLICSYTTRIIDDPTWSYLTPRYNDLRGFGACYQSAAGITGVLLDPLILTSGIGTSELVKIDESSLIDLDNVPHGTAIATTIDFVNPEEYLVESRSLLVEMEAYGSGSLKIEYSTDEGSNWTTITAAQSLTTAWTYYAYRPDIRGRKVRFRLTHTMTTSQDFRLRMFRVQYTYGGRA